MSSPFPDFMQNEDRTYPQWLGKWYVVVGKGITSTGYRSPLYLSSSSAALFSGVRIDGGYDHYYFDSREDAEYHYALWLLRGCPIGELA